MALRNDQTLKQLQQVHSQSGQLVWIGLRPSHRDTITVVRTARLISGKGISGDHRAHTVGSHGKRQITLIQAEHLPVIAALCNRSDIDPAWLRRNLVISGINLLTLKGMTFRLGEVLLKGSGLCHPCSRMEENLGPGGYNAVRGHGGITAEIISGGQITIGDALYVLPEPVSDANQV